MSLVDRRPKSFTVGRVIALGVMFVVGAGPACAALAGIDDLAIGDCKGGQCKGDATTIPTVTQNDSGPLPAVDSGTPCKGKGPAGVRVGSDGNTFCIDATEVSFAQYKEFLAAKVDPTKQPATCAAWNTSFEPQLPGAPPDSDAGPPPPPPDDHPVSYVTWCDALAYCTWAGKYLCGTVTNGKKTGPVTVETMADYRSHQWLLACSAEATLRYPYGPLVDPSKCNLYEYDAGATIAIGSAPGCIGGYAGIHDMMGNVWEYYDSPCPTASLEVDGGDGGPQSDGCGLKGGSYGDQAGGIYCGTDVSVRRDFTGANVGFRCCSD